jgi:hypothetical protein
MEQEARYKWGNANIRLTREADRYTMRVEKLRDRSIEGFVNIALGVWTPAYQKEQEIMAFFMPASIIALVSQHHAAFDYTEEQRDNKLRFGGKALQDHAAIREVDFIIDADWSLRVLHIVFQDGATYTATYTHQRLDGRDSPWIVTGADAKVVSAKGVERRFTLKMDYQKTGGDESYWVFKTVVREIQDADGKTISKGPNDPNPITYEYKDYTITDPPKRAAAPKPPVGDLWNLVQ